MKYPLIIIALIALIVGSYCSYIWGYKNKASEIEHQPNLELTGLNIVEGKAFFKFTDDLHEKDSSIWGLNAWWLVNIDCDKDTVRLNISCSEFSTNRYYYHCVFYRDSLIKKSGRMQGCFDSYYSTEPPIIIQSLLKYNRLEKFPPEMRKLLEVALN